MRESKRQYKICKEACKEKGCHLPLEHEFHQTLANTPEFIRVFFFLSGWKSCEEETLQKSRKKSTAQNNTVFTNIDKLNGKSTAQDDKDS